MLKTGIDTQPLCHISTLHRNGRNDQTEPNAHQRTAEVRYQDKIPVLLCKMIVYCNTDSKYSVHMDDVLYVFTNAIDMSMYELK